MANFKLTQTGEQIQADLNLLDRNSATSGQVLTANGTGGASWQNASGSGGLYYHSITITSAQDTNVIASFGLYSTRSEAFTLSSLCRYLYNFAQLPTQSPFLNVIGYIQDKIDPAEETSEYGYFSTLSVNAPHENENYIYLYYSRTYLKNSIIHSSIGNFVFGADATFEASVIPV